MIAALTFDDGPDGRWTPQILDLLYDAETHATFFVTGVYLSRPGAKELIWRMVDEGHEVGNHTWSHKHLSLLSDRDVSDEIRRGALAVAEIVGSPSTSVIPVYKDSPWLQEYGPQSAWPKLWRAPYLDLPESARLWGARYGARHVGCDIITGDWNSSDPQLIAMAALSSLRDGSIVLLHDGIPPDGGSGSDSRQPTCDALALLLETPGISWCSVSELG